MAQPMTVAVHTATPHPLDRPAHTSTTAQIDDVLRHVSSLAARARIEAITRGEHEARDQLRGLLEQVCAWDPHTVHCSDPALLALTSAGLEDLRDTVARSPQIEDLTRWTRALVRLDELGRG